MRNFLLGFGLTFCLSLATPVAAQETPATPARGEDPPPGESDPQKSSGLLRQGRDRGSVSVFKLIDAERASYPVAMLCRMLGVSKKSG